jgi:hypothetical protein
MVVLCFEPDDWFIDRLRGLGRSTAYAPSDGYVGRFARDNYGWFEHDIDLDLRQRFIGHDQ